MSLRGVFPWDASVVSFCGLLLCGAVVGCFVGVFLWALSVGRFGWVFLWYVAFHGMMRSVMILFSASLATPVDPPQLVSGSKAC